MSEQHSIRALVIGASSGIAKALIQQLLAESGRIEITAISRGQAADAMASDRLSWIQSDYSEDSIESIVAELMQAGTSFNRIFICNGILHDRDLVPEKRLQDLDSDSLHAVMHVNTVVPALWLKAIKSLLQKKQRCVVTAFSARIGSIEDNRRGGWYAYRTSKAALNMLLKTAAIEFRRSAPQTTFLAFHPGTTDTPLSRPFQKNVPPEKLFTPAFVAKQLLSIVDKLDLDLPMHYLDWDGKTIPW